MQSKKVLFVLTNTEKLGDSGHKTGAYLSEITHPYEELLKGGYEIEMVSPQGGKVPLDGVRMDDPVNATWMNEEEFLSKIENTLVPDRISAKDYSGIFYVGGHGAMFDLADNIHLQKITAEIYENNGVVGSVCHGTAGLVNVRLRDGNYLIKGHEISGFSNEEERSVGMEKTVPFLLQNKIEERGGHYSSSSRFTPHVVTSGRIVTGQNPSSGSPVGKAFLKALNRVAKNSIVQSPSESPRGIL